MNRSRSLPLVAAVLVIGLATLVPLGDVPPRFDWRFEWSDVLVNLCLYLPFGLLLARRYYRPARIVLAAVALSGAIELLQGTVITGRRGAPADVIANLLGAAAGIAIYRAALELRQSRHRGAFLLAVLLAAFPLLFWVASAALLAPSPPVTPQWWGQWMHRFTGTEPFHGSILSVSFLDHPVPDDRIDSTAALLAQARQGILKLEVTLLSGGSTAGLTHLASVADGVGGVVIGLHQLGDDLLLAWRSQGAKFGLRRPQVIFPGALRSSAGDRLIISATVTASGAGATIRSAAESRATERRFSGLSGWRNLIPIRGLSPLAERLLDLVWLLGAVGYILVAIWVLRPGLVTPPWSPNSKGARP